MLGYECYCKITIVLIPKFRLFNQFGGFTMRMILTFLTVFMFALRQMQNLMILSILFVTEK